MNENVEVKRLIIFLLKGIWIFICTFATLLTVIWQCYKYGKGEDVTQVEYKNFNENELDIYPSIALCFTMAIKEERLSGYGYNVTPRQYADFLQGNSGYGIRNVTENTNNMMKIDYQNVIQHLDEYILAYGYTNNGVKTGLRDVLMYPFNALEPTSSNKMRGFKELAFMGMMCLTIDIPYKKDRDTLKT